MSDLSRQYHSITFVKRVNNSYQTKNTWDNWHLIPTSRPVMSRPTANYKYIDIPGMDGALDITNYLVGKPTYSDRSGSFEFYIMNDYAGYDRTSLLEEMASFLDGSEMKIYLEDDQPVGGGKYYKGRVYLKDERPGANFSTISMDYRVEPESHNG